MAKCFSCGKNFEYEKYYGICPKCGAYNRKDTSEAEHMKLHEQYDIPQDIPMTHYYNAQSESSPKKPSALGTVIFVLLIIGIVTGIVSPVIYIAGRAVGVGMNAVTGMDFSEGVLEESIPFGEADDVIREAQKADTIEWQTNRACSLGSKGELEITVEEARVLVSAGHVSDFPEGEKLVAISLNYNNLNENYYNYMAVSKFYVGYGENLYKETVGSYYMEDYLNLLNGVRILDEYEVSYGEGQGELLVFVPEELEQMDLYLESRDEVTNEMLEIYRIPLEIKPGKEI